MEKEIFELALSERQERAERARREKQPSIEEGKKLMRALLGGDIRPEEILAIIESGVKTISKGMDVIESSNRVIALQQRVIELYERREQLFEEIISLFEDLPGYKRAKAEWLARQLKPRQVFIKSDAKIKAISGRNIRSVQLVKP